MFDTVACHGGLDVLMNDAGIFQPAQLLDTSTEMRGHAVALPHDLGPIDPDNLRLAMPDHATTSPRARADSSRRRATTTAGEQST